MARRNKAFGNGSSVVVRLGLIGVVFLLAALLTSWASASTLPNLLFQSVQPKPTIPPAWVAAAQGGVRSCGPTIKVVAPQNFTQQGGANIICDMLIVPSDIDPNRLVSKTEFALGIWPPNDQTDFDLPLELVITLDAAIVKKTPAGFDLLMYDQKMRSWQVVNANFNKNTWQLIATVQKLKPVAKDYPNWGGRTLFALVKKTPKAKPAYSGSAKPTKTPTHTERVSTATPTALPTIKPSATAKH